jgi:Polyketide cyclase / dehydrase and lipid transport
MPVDPETVWAVLARPGSYGYWVVGSKQIRDADPDWPAPGSKFHHTIGLGPFKVRDHTESLDARRPAELRLRAKGRPLGTAVVSLSLIPRSGGTVVRMTENPDGLTALLAFNPLVDLFTMGRNEESLMRLEELALVEAARSGTRKAAPRRRAQAAIS